MKSAKSTHNCSDWAYWASANRRGSPACSRSVERRRHLAPAMENHARNSSAVTSQYRARPPKSSLPSCRSQSKRRPAWRKRSAIWRQCWTSDPRPAVACMHVVSRGPDASGRVCLEWKCYYLPIGHSRCPQILMVVQTGGPPRRSCSPAEWVWFS